MNNIHEDDVGTLFKTRIVSDSTGDTVDISDATDMIMTFQPPESAASFERDASFSTNGADGYIQYLSVAGDLTPNGNWSLQARVTGPGYENSSEIKSFKVLPNL